MPLCSRRPELGRIVGERFWEARLESSYFMTISASDCRCSAAESTSDFVRILLRISGLSG